MAINEISCNRPEVIFSFRIIPCWVILKWCWTRESAWFSSKNFLFLSSERSRIKVNFLRRCSHPKILTVPSATEKIKLSPSLGVNTSFTLSLLAWSSDPSAPTLQCLLLECLLSRFLPRTRHTRGISLARLVTQSDVISLGISQK